MSLTGKMYDHFNLKVCNSRRNAFCLQSQILMKVMQWTFLVFFFALQLGSALCGAAQTSAMLIVGRTIAGLGASGIINGSFTIISASVPLEKRPPLIGACMGISQLGQVIGPLIGGAFTTGYTWRWSFYISSLNYGLFMAVVFGGVFYLPIYFQAIREKSAMLSGVYLMPNILPQILTTILTGVLGKSHTQASFDHC